MNINITIQHGPVDIEFEAEGEEEYMQEILDFAEFLEENKQELEIFEGESTATGGTRNIQYDLSERGQPEKGEAEKNEQENDSIGDSSEDPDDSGPLSPISEATGIAEADLEHLIVADPGADRKPELVITDLNILGEKDVDKKRTAALMLLYVYHECYDEERVSSSDLKESFVRSDVPEQHINNAYNDEGKRFFDPTGRGGSATVALRGPGKRAAVKEIKRVIGEMEF